MAGMSNRFREAGYEKPKYALELHGQSVFDWAISSFKRYFMTEAFLFVIRPDDFAQQFIEQAIPNLGIRRYEIYRLNSDTAGQAHTAWHALKNYNVDFPVTIFNIDTFRFDYSYPDFIDECDAYLEVFRGEGDQWSFVEPGPHSTVLKTAEKERISDFCSDGLYFFKSRRAFCTIFEKAMADNYRVHGEFYIAPLYNYLISAGALVKYCLVDRSQLAFCGTPAEYRLLENCSFL